MKILLATQNAGKLREFQALFANSGHTLVSLEDFDLEQAEETGQTFVENALLKARSAAQATGLPCLADDSGLAVAALNGAPGIYSARYAGPGPHVEATQDQANNAKLLATLGSTADRRAHFYCALVLLRSTNDPAPLVATGQWHGYIGSTPSGSNGFGYDPLFIEASSNKTAASLSPEEKHARSHRGLAWQVLQPQLSAL